MQAIVLWSDRAFLHASPLALAAGGALLRPEIAGVIRAVCDPVLPAMTRDARHALRMAARVGARH